MQISWEFCVSMILSDNFAVVSDTVVIIVLKYLKKYALLNSFPIFKPFPVYNLQIFKFEGKLSESQ
jgi:hypothetical protein